MVARVRSFIVLLATALLLGHATAQVEAVRDYLLEGVAVQKQGTAALLSAAERYQALVTEHGGVAQAAQADPQGLAALMREAREAWRTASRYYEGVEGIVAGVEQLVQFDVELDGGVSESEGGVGGEGVVSFDIALANGRVFEKPGPLFSVTEAALWNTEPAYGSGVALDVDGDGVIGFGDGLPDPALLLAAAKVTDAFSAESIEAALAWVPTEADVFGALAGNVPTTAETFIARWMESRFVLGEASELRDMVAISSLRDLSQNITSWQSLYGGVRASVDSVDPVLSRNIDSRLLSLRAWVDGLVAQEDARRFSPEQAEPMHAEGDDRATAITGLVVQAAGLQSIELED